MTKAKPVKFERPLVEDEKPETYRGGLEEHAKNTDELALKLVDACDPYNTAVILDALEVVMRGAVTLMGDEEGQLFEDMLQAFHKRLAAMTILRSLFGGRLDALNLLKRQGGAEDKQSLDSLIADMEAAGGKKPEGE